MSCPRIPNPGRYDKKRPSNVALRKTERGPKRCIGGTHRLPDAYPSIQIGHDESRREVDDVDDVSKPVNLVQSEPKVLDNL